MKRNHHLAFLIIPLMIMMGVFLPHPELSSAQGEVQQVVVLRPTGPIIPPIAGYIERGVRYADEINAEAVILILDTPGGLVDTTFDIIQTLTGSDVPVIVYVAPSGAQSASAGLLIVLSGHISAMAPGTAIGASSPIDLSGTDLDSTAQAKAEEYLSAQARTLAAGRGDEAISLASEAVTEARAVSNDEAFDAGLIDHIANDLDDLIKQVDGSIVSIQGRELTLQVTDAEIVEVEMTLLEEILTIVVNPNIVALFLTLGPLLIIIEVKTPGGWVAGTLGAIMTGLALYGLGVLPVNWLGIIFVGIAITLFVLEVKAPTHGILATVAVANVVVGSIILFSGPGIEEFGRLSIPLLIGQSLIIGVLFAFFAYMVMRALKLPVTTGYEGLVGKQGRVTVPLNPEGSVMVWGERWKAISESGDPIAEGERVEVTRAGGHSITVKKICE